MSAYLPVPDPITAQWLTATLREAGLLTHGQVLTVTTQPTGAFNSHTQRLQLGYSADAPANLPTQLILKRNIPEPWAIEAGALEATFYQVVARLQPPPPALVPCYAAAYDAASGNSYLLLRDLSETHAPPVTSEQQLRVVDGVPSPDAITRVTDTLAQHHAYWWNHPLLRTESFAIGYWSRDAERFAQYLRRRQTAWESLRADEASWFPVELRELYDEVLHHLPRHWKQHLEPRFRTQTHLTLVHGDAYFANFLCPKDGGSGATYLLDWQSPVVDIGGYDLVTLCATFWSEEQRHEAQREERLLKRYYATLQTHGVTNYSWEELVADYQAGLIYWLLVPLQDRYDGSPKAYWWPKMQCLVAALRDWRCDELLAMAKE